MSSRNSAAIGGSRVSIPDLTVGGVLTIIMATSLVIWGETSPDMKHAAQVSLVSFVLQLAVVMLYCAAANYFALRHLRAFVIVAYLAIALIILFAYGSVLAAVFGAILAAPLLAVLIRYSGKIFKTILVMLSLGFDTRPKPPQPNRTTGYRS